MNRTAAELRGEVLRAWREYAGVSNADLARDLHASRASISMLESGDRATRSSPRLPQIGAIAEALGLPRNQRKALQDMWSAAGSVTVVPPRTRWAHNFAEQLPAWAWVRPREASADGTAVHVTNWWGEALQGSRRLACGPGGVILCYPTTVTNPPPEVSLGQAGWVDFGRGAIPAAIAARLGAVLLDAREIIGSSMPADPPLSADDRREGRTTLGRARDVALSLGLGWRIFAPHVGMLRPHHVAHSLDGSSLEPAAWPGQVTTDNQGNVERQALVSAAQLRALREGRGLSREQVASDVSALDPGNRVTAHAIETMEATGRFPDVTGVVSALDHVYGCDGRLGLDRVFDSVAVRPGKGNKYSVRFPAYYVGPVWVQAAGRDANDTGMIDLTWGSWRRRQRVRSAMLLTTRKARRDSVPLVIAIPGGWRAVAGTGAAPTAADINHGWHPVTFKAGIAMLREGVDAILAAQGTPIVRPNPPQ